MDIVTGLVVYLQVAPRLYEGAISLTTAKGLTHLQSQSKATSNKLSSILRLVQYHCQTIYYLTSSDLKTIALPWLLFGIAHAFAAPHFDMHTSQSTAQLLCRLPLAMLTIMLNLICFNISNQRSKAAIAQDRVNKPWRPYVTRRLNPSKSGDLLIVCTFITYFITRLTGGKQASLAIAIGTYLYNDCGGSEHFLTRDPLNGLGVLTFGIAATQALLGPSASVSYSPSMLTWWMVLFAITTAGIHVPDHQDKKGDAKQGRKTFVLVFGEDISRWTVAISAVASSIWAPYHLGLSMMTMILPIAMALLVSYRTITKRDVKSDKTTYKFWGLWLMTVYTLPAFTLF